mmetsp:Transcript_86871/g.137786  ORF Transcript_86871/g.137786 Transcript_86871/m.137786 type:complete len:253 (+) Transcript_86871:76-834(+)
MPGVTVIGRLGWKSAAAWAHDVLGRIRRSQPQNIHTSEILEALLHAFHGGFLCGADAGAGVVVLLVGLVLAIRVANLRLQIVVVLGFKVTDTVPVGPLRVRVDVHLDDTIIDGFSDILDIRATATVEDETHGLGTLLCTDLLGDVLLSLIQDGGLQLHIAWLVHAMDVAKGCGDGEETIGNFAQGVVDLENLLGFGVQVFRVRIFVVDAVLFTTCDSQFHLQAAVDLRHALHVFHANLDVLFQWLLGQVQHV